MPLLIGVRRGGNQHDVLRWFLYENKKGAVSDEEVAPFKMPSVIKTVLPAVLRRGLLIRDPAGNLQITQLGVQAVLVHEEQARRRPPDR